MKTIVPFTSILLSVLMLIISIHSFSQSGSELSFTNSILASGTPLSQGAAYRFNNVKTGVDAIIRMKKFSRPDIHMATIDNTVFGWDKAFQPEFGLQGSVAPNQNWFIDFEVTFYDAGTNNRKKLDTIDFTALDVDGDGVSISEYVVYDRPNSIIFSTTTALTTSPEGLIGSNATCSIDDITSSIITCVYCGGSGVVGSVEDHNCSGSGKLHSLCSHPYEGISGTNIHGPVVNFSNIDTSATLVMSVYRYLNRDRINFRYGARSGALSSTAGTRLNSMWFRRFNVGAQNVLPVYLTSFRGVLRNNQVDLNWAVENQSQIKKYIIEKSTDGKKFKECGIVMALNNEASSRNYMFTDVLSTNNATLIYYRLQIVNQKGESSYSDIRVIRTVKTENANIKIVTYPNPVADEVKITIPEDWQNKKVVYELYNSTGQIAIRKEVLSSGQTEALNINNLNKGIYIVTVMCNGSKAQQKVVKF